jgi:hypothetical protein
VVWAGTTNGRVQLTRDDAKSWADVTPPGLADWSKVNFVDASVHDPATAYVSADRHRLDDDRPLAFRTHDFGATWTAIGSGLPAGEWVGVVRQDPVAANLLYAGTNRGVHVSFDDGGSWQPLDRGLPTTGINDLLVHGDDLVVATQGRALWILDGVGPLREAARAGAPSALALHPPATALRVRFNANKDTPLPPEEPMGENPPAGAVFDYFVPEGFTGPLALEIVDSGGRVVRRFASGETAAGDEVEARVYFTDRYLGPRRTLSAEPGHRRFVWNLRGERPRALEYEYAIAAVAGRETEKLPAGAYVSPGSYTARLSAGGKTIEQPLTVAPDPRIHAQPGDFAALEAFYREVAAELSRSADLALEKQRFEARLGSAEKDEKARPLWKEIGEVRAQIAVIGAGRVDPETVNGELAGLATDLEHADAPPTGPQRQLLADARTRLDSWKPAWEKLDARKLTALARQLEKLRL